MVCTPCFIWGEWGGESYKRRVMGERATFRERNRLQVSCAEHDVTMAQLYIKQHMASLHGVCVPQPRGVNDKGELPTTYVVSLPRILPLVRCPVPGCPAVVHTAGRMRENFMFQHFWSQIAVVQEGKESLPRCDLRGMHMPAGRLIVGICR